MRRSPRLVLIAIGGLLVCTAPAAATPIVRLGGISQSPAPQVIVDATGQGYTTWADAAPSNALEYCRLSPGTSSCLSRRSFAYPAGPDVGTGGESAPVFTAGGAVALLDSRCCATRSQKFLYLSTDQGQTFGAPTQLTADQASGMQGGVLDVPAGALASGLPEELVTADASDVTGGGSIQGTPLASSSLTPGYFTPPVQFGTLSESIGRQGSQLVTVYTQASTDRVSWSVDSGGDPNLASSWSAPQDLSPAPSLDSHAQLASGPSGIFVVRSIKTAGDNESLVIQHFTGGGWSSPVTVTPTAAGEKFAISETPTGAVYVIWTDTSGPLDYRIAADSAATRFGAVQTLVTGGTIGFPQIAVNAAGAGWATWTDSVTHAFAIPILPAPKITDLGLSDGAKVALGTPRGCVAPGATFTVTLGFRRSKRKGALFVKVTRVDFSVAGSRIKSVRRAPFRATLTLRASAKHGSSVRIRARATIKVHHGKPPKKSIYAKVRVC